jgi:hypothetical protein
LSSAAHTLLEVGKRCIDRSQIVYEILRELFAGSFAQRRRPNDAQHR